MKTRSRTFSWEDPIPTRDAGATMSGGGRVATAEGKLIAQNTGKLLAHGTSTCLVIPK